MTLSLVSGSFGQVIGSGTQASSQAPSQQVPGEALVLTKAELALRRDLVAVEGVIYDLNAFAPNHPGGDVIRSTGGTDATAVFHQMHTEHMIKRGRRILEKYRVGTLVSSSDTAGQDETDVKELFPQGLYIYGGPGCGKTFAMDLFFESLPTGKKRRVHFHQFMLEIHRHQHIMKDQGLGDDIFLHIVDKIKDDCHILCLDEFMITDVADAMIVRKLFEALWRGGVVVVATSNRDPKELYRNGIQRHLFLPFIDELQERCKVTHLRSDTDYRLENMRRMQEQQEQQTSSTGRDRYFIKRGLGKNINKEFEDLWQLFTNGEEEVESCFIDVHGRQVEIPQVDEGRRVARVSFSQLCGDVEQPMSVADYIAMAREFDIIFVEAVPQIDLRDIDVARRFISFVDIMYDHKAGVIIDSFVEINELLNTHGLDDEGAAAILLRGNADIMGDEYLSQTVHDLDQPGDVEYNSLENQGSVDELFAFERAKSRLHEMQSPEYAQKATVAHCGLPAQPDFMKC